VKLAKPICPPYLSDKINISPSNNQKETYCHTSYSSHKLSYSNYNVQAQAHPRVLVIVMLPLPPSVWIFLLWTTGFPEIADASCEFGPSSLLCFILYGGGAWIFLFMSFRVTAPWKLHGLMSSKGKTTDVLCFFALIILLPAVKQRNYITSYAF
jgi:hypothetical protein